MSEKTSRGNRAPVLIGMGCFLGGLVFLGIGAFKTWEGWQTLQWPSVEGAMGLVNVRSVLVTATGAKSLRQEWKPELQYSYQVNDKLYTGERVNIYGLGSRPSEVEARQELAAWKRGDPVQVHYDPDNPAASVLLPGYSKVLPVSMGILCLMVWGVGGLVIWQNKPDPPQDAPATGN